MKYDYGHKMDPKTKGPQHAFDMCTERCTQDCTQDRLHALQYFEVSELKFTSPQLLQQIMS